MSIIDPELGEPIVAPSFCVKDRLQKWAVFDDIVISTTSSVHSFDGIWYVLVSRIILIACMHLSLSQLGSKFSMSLLTIMVSSFLEGP